LIGGRSAVALDPIRSINVAVQLPPLTADSHSLFERAIDVTPRPSIQSSGEGRGVTPRPSIEFSWKGRGVVRACGRRCEVDAMIKSGDRRLGTTIPDTVDGRRERN
jgi:hypothetical protein